MFIPVTERASLLEVYLCSAGTHASESLTCTEETNKASCALQCGKAMFLCP